MWDRIGNLGRTTKRVPPDKTALEKWDKELISDKESSGKFRLKNIYSTQQKSKVGQIIRVPGTVAEWLKTFYCD